jgi:hypothetical protein
LQKIGRFLNFLIVSMSVQPDDHSLANACC